MAAADPPVGPRFPIYCGWGRRHVSPIDALLHRTVAATPPISQANSHCEIRNFSLYRSSSVSEDKACSTPLDNRALLDPRLPQHSERGGEEERPCLLLLNLILYATLVPASRTCLTQYAQFYIGWNRRTCRIREVVRPAFLAKTGKKGK